MCLPTFLSFHMLHLRKFLTNEIGTGQGETNVFSLMGHIIRNVYVGGPHALLVLPIYP